MKTIQKKRKKAVNRTYTAPKSLTGMDNPLGKTFDGSFKRKYTEDEVEEMLDDLGIALAKKLGIPLD